MDIIDSVTGLRSPIKSTNGEIHVTSEEGVRSALLVGDFAPGFGGDASSGTTRPQLGDPDGNTAIRGPVLTDERGYRANFANTSLFVSIGTCTFTNGSDIVLGTGFIASDIRHGDYVRLTADAESALVAIEYITDTTITLVSAYTGTGGTGLAQRSIMKTATGAGGAVSVASGVATITSGTTATSITELERDVDYLPVAKQAGVSVSQRIANQTTYIGFYDEGNPAAPRWFAWFALDGTTNTTVKCQSARNPTGAPSAAEVEETSLTLPNGLTTATTHRYLVEVLNDSVVFSIDGMVVATHYKSMPGPGDILTSTVRVQNGTTPASTTTVTIDYDMVKNHNALQIQPFSEGMALTARSAPMVNSTFTQAGVIAINTTLMTVDCQRFASLLLSVASLGTTGVITIQGAGDAAFTAPFTQHTLSSVGVLAATITTAGLYQIPVTAPFMRVRLTTATTAGTTTLFLSGSSAPVSPWWATQPISGTVTANIGTGSIAAGTNAVGDVGGVIRTGTGGLSTPARIISAAASTNGTVVKASAGRLYKITGYNAAATVRYIKLSNSATVTVGTTAVVDTIALKPLDVFDIDFGVIGRSYATGICFGLTTGSADNDTGALTAADIVGMNVYFA